MFITKKGFSSRRIKESQLEAAKRAALKQTRTVPQALKETTTTTVYVEPIVEEEVKNKKTKKVKSNETTECE